jgi:hypothetical protein
MGKAFKSDKCLDKACVWVADNYKSCELLGLAYVSEVKKLDHTANPCEIMSLVSILKFMDIKDAIFALITDIRSRLPIECRSVTDDLTKEYKWSIESIVANLTKQRLK